MDLRNLVTTGRLTVDRKNLIQEELRRRGF
jgi:hypothetical protein